MNIASIISKVRQRLRLRLYHLLDSLYLPLDRTHLRRTRNIRLIPRDRNRTGGKYAYAEWAHVIGVFQTLMFLQLAKKENNAILDVGCGAGLLAIASEPFLGPAGKYTGIDVVSRDIDFCRRHYPAANFEFIHFDVGNPLYAQAQGAAQLPWPVESGSIDLTTALSVWTHLNEEDALFYFGEIGRVLKPGGKAIVTLFVLDETYRNSLGLRSAQEGRFHTTSQELWVFSESAYGSDAWLHPKWATCPEHAIGVTEAGLERLVADSGMKLIDRLQGNWKEVPGAFFQD
ncbi:class I SAM-dependent methyltransferase, partial [Candidatus Sumerlaeota bacterium]